MLLMASCSPQMASLHQDRLQSSLALSEIREELADLKHGLNNTQVELQILEEQVKKKQPASTYTPIKGIDKGIDSKLAGLEKKIEKLSDHANQTSQCLSEYKAKIAELEATVEKQTQIITSTLSSLKNSFQASENIIHKVKAGDSLEKIAKLYKITVTALKEENRLSHDTIIIGQELKIPPSALP